MEKHLPFNFPFASHYFYLQIFEFSWGERALTFSSRRQVFFGEIRGERRENFLQLTARLVLQLSKWYASLVPQRKAIYHNCITFSSVFRFMLIYTFLIRIRTATAAPDKKGDLQPSGININKQLTSVFFSPQSDEHYVSRKYYLL